MQKRNDKGQNALDLLRGSLGPITKYLDAPEFQEIMINRPDDIWVESSGKMWRVEETLSPKSVEMAIRALATVNDKNISDIMDARLPGIRVAAVMEPIAVYGNAMSIRKHSNTNLVFENYVESGAFSILSQEESDKWFASHKTRPAQEVVAAGGDGLRLFFEWAMENRKNVLIAGGTSSGKTTLLNAFLAAMPAFHRIITIEDTAELKFFAPNRVSFEANKERLIDIRSLVKVCLRFRPDRIVVGEVRGAEAYDLVDALNTGHSGGVATIHADTAESALDRLENLMRMAPDAANYPNETMRRQISATFDFVVQASNLGGKRGPVRVVEVTGYENGRYLFNEIFSRIPKGSNQ